MKKAIVTLGVAAALAACDPNPPPPDTVVARVDTGPGAGTIYIIRGLDPVILGGARVKIDGQSVASLLRDDYVKVDVQPGQHRLGCGEADSALVADVAPGRPAYVEAVLRVTMLAPTCTLTLLDEVNGQRRITAGKRVGP